MQFNFDASTLIITLVSIVISLSVHEMMHALVGLRLGDTTAHDEGRVSLNPLRHIDPFATVLLPIMTLLLFQVPVLAAKPVPFNPARLRFDEFGAALVAAAGPLSNLALAGVGALLAHVLSASPEVYNALTIFTALNVGLFIFNAIPIPPLDGSRVLYAFAPDAVRGFMEQIEPYGIYIIFGLVIFVRPFAEILVNLNSALTLFLL